jgi:hypothetical protein
MCVQDQLREDYGADKGAHGTGGPLPVADVVFKTPLADAFLQAGRDLGGCSALLGSTRLLCMLS